MRSQALADLFAAILELDSTSAMRAKMIELACEFLEFLVRTDSVDALVFASFSVPCRSEECEDDIKKLRQDIIDASTAKWIAEFEYAIDSESMNFLVRR